LEGARRWSIWAAAYGGHNKTTGDPVLVGSHDRTARTFGLATGLDYGVTPYTTVGFALAGGGTRYDLSGGFGGGRSDMFQAAVYSLTRVNAAYISAALAYAWHRVSTNRFLTVAGGDHLTADFSAHNVGGRIEGGYRFAIPDVYGWYGFGLTPYGAVQVQAFRTPSYSERAVSGSSVFALAYEARTTTTTRTELGAWFDRTLALDSGTFLTLRTRTAWAHDNWSDPSVAATFLALPGSRFTEFGAAPARDSLLSSASAEISFRNRISLAGKFDSEFAQHSQTYIGTARLRYTW
jgi:outer membrane autotransporter protein